MQNLEVLNIKNKGLLNTIQQHKHEFILLFFIIIYIVVWSVITVDRFLSFHAYVYDAGLFMQGWYDVVFVHWTPYSFFMSFTLRGIKFILFPIVLPRSFALLFIFQTIFISLGSPLVYYISISRNLSKNVGLILSISYLFFFALAGANFFDIHNISFLPTLLLAGYYFSLRGKRAPSIFFFLLASMVKYPLSMLIAFFVLLLILDLHYGDRYDEIHIKRSKLQIYVTVFIFSVVLFLSRYIYFTLSSHLIVPGDAHLSGFFGPQISNYDILITVLIFLAPFIFLPLLSIRSLPFCVGYFGLLAITRFWGYGYPYGITTIYMYQLAPFIYIGTIEVLSGRTFLKIFTRFFTVRYRNQKHKIYKYIHKFNLKSVRFAYYVLFAILVLAVFFEPFGPLNDVNNDISFHMNQILSINETEYKDVESLVQTVPSNDPYVVIQNGLPEFFPRNFNMSGNPMETGGILEVPGVGGGLPYNLSYENSNGVWQKIRIDYVVADPYQSTYYEALAPPYNLSMYDLVRELYDSGNYGIYSEINGMIVLKHYYNETSPHYYTPFKDYFTGNVLSSPFIKKDNVTISDISTSKGQYLQVWQTPTIPISPGEYEINITYSYMDSFGNKSDYQIIVSTSGNTIDNATTYNLNPENLGTQGRTHVLHLYEDITDFSDNFKIFAQIPPNTQWSGPFNVSGVSIDQIGTLFNSYGITSGYIAR